MEVQGKPGKFEGRVLGKGRGMVSLQWSRRVGDKVEKLSIVSDGKKMVKAVPWGKDAGVALESVPTEYLYDNVLTSSARAGAFLAFSPGLEAGWAEA